RRRRYVSLSRTDEHGLRHLIARIHTADAIWIDAMLNRIADRTQDQHPGATHDELRSHAMGWLARPAELLQLLLTGNQESAEDPAQQAADTQPTGQPDDEEPVVDREDPHTGDPVPAEPVDNTPSRALAFPADLLGVARVEESGPVDLTQLTELLRHAFVKVTPVLDLADQISSNAYEIPEAVKQHTHLTTPGDYFPHAATTARAQSATGPPHLTAPAWAGSVKGLGRGARPRSASHYPRRAGDAPPK
ncbi:MAG: hypothetical protein Q8Q44_05945, partial [Nocardioides sp.]|nr:hypothetical protein [Nocardioides sp.]